MIDLGTEERRLIEDVAKYGTKEAARMRSRAPQTIKNRLHLIHKKTDTTRLAELVWYVFVEPY